jgi:hypothetical protein
MEGCSDAFGTAVNAQSNIRDGRKEACFGIPQKRKNTIRHASRAFSGFILFLRGENFLATSL